MSRNFSSIRRAISAGLSSLQNHKQLSSQWCTHLKRQIVNAKPLPKKNILYSAVCVERTPVVTSTKTELEEKFGNLSAQVELENSYYSDHEIRLKKEEKSSKKKSEDDAEKDEGATETALDLEDKWDAELKRFVAASRITEADKTNDRKSLERKLDTSLYLLVKQNIEGRDHWVLPQATWEEGETMRQTAERALSGVCGNVKATILGNAPCAVAKYEPKNPQEEKGIKLFFFKAWYRDGTVTPNKKFASDYLWVTKEELAEYCHDGYRRSLKKFLS